MRLSEPRDEAAAVGQTGHSSVEDVRVTIKPSVCRDLHVNATVEDADRTTPADFFLPTGPLARGSRYAARFDQFDCRQLRGGPDAAPTGSSMGRCVPPLPPEAPGSKESRRGSGALRLRRSGVCPLRTPEVRRWVSLCGVGAAIASVEPLIPLARRPNRCMRSMPNHLTQRNAGAKGIRAECDACRDLRRQLACPGRY